MKGDFTRNTFNKQNHFSRVLMQQGRVQLDADWNEQAAILLHYLHTLATDLIGSHGGPEDSLGFAVIKAEKLDEEEPIEEELDEGELDRATRISLTKSGLLPLKDGDFLITKGRYYVDGLLCENDDYVLFTNQPDRMPEAITISTYPSLVYLDVWERLITYIEDDEIREVALNGPDTAVRSQLVWQVKTQTVKDATCSDVMWGDLVEEWQPANRGYLKAQAKTTDATDTLDSCTTSPDARYRGVENQLYRVEIHREGRAWDEQESTKESAATFKWSRENGSVTFPVQTINEEIVTVENLGRDGRFSLQKNDWVEVVDDDTVLHGLAEPLLKVIDVNPMTHEVTLGGEPTNVSDDETKHSLLRRWDHKAGGADQFGLTLDNGAALIHEGTEKGDWLNLEDGIQIQFQPGGTYRTGDYWLIPARTAIGDIEWPKNENGEPSPDSPHGVDHHYAPLAIGKADAMVDCRRHFGRLLTTDKTLTADQIAAIDAADAADAPSGNNPFVTKSELPTSQLTSAQVNAIKKATRASSKNPFVTKADMEPKE